METIYNLHTKSLLHFSRSRTLMATISLSGARDLSFDAYGYATVFLSNITTAIYLATIARVGRIPVLSYPHTVEILYLFSL